ncbi:MAG TPA: asparagine synthase (glutamine-hydrolyzing) [Verrucomicrobiae bacterium]|nr:asparagine synthase (glutamine-hydrolyzing) [Verrucomicrobiae bacterium]
MCGIAGKLNFEQDRAVDPGLIQRMCDVIAHRGPDDAGVWCDGPIGLGHRRLAVIDLSELGRQPMCTADGSLWITFNGEIYNYLELRQELEQHGYQFRSRTDTEVILNLYHRDGIECLQRLRGMFAFAIWDTRRRELFLARDRVGKKPLCYHADEYGITFGSEIKAVLQDPDVDREPDPVAIHHYLTYQCVPAPLCAFTGVHKLHPGHYLLARHGHFEVRRYWKLSHRPKFAAATARERRLLELELLQRLDEATSLRMAADVPVGAFLSGGVDSGAVVAMMSDRSSAPVRTFSIGFEDGAYNELAYARKVARHFGTDHTEFVVKPDALEVLPQLVWHFDEPFADASAIPTWYLSKLAREHVTVALSGDGGDESFAGYDRHVANHFAGRLGALKPLLGSRAFRHALDLLPGGAGSTSPGWRLKRFVEQLGREPQARNAAWLAHFDLDTKHELYSAAFRHWAGARDAEEMLYARYREADADNFTDATLYADIHSYLPDTLLVKLDIASMAHGLEARSPFLDHEFMEFAARLPEDMKLQGGRTKVALKRALRGVLPDDVLDRRKMGFNAPLDRWLRRELKELSYDLLLSLRARSRGYFQPRFVERMLHEHSQGTRNWHTQIWNLMMLESWHRAFVDESAAAMVRPA